MKHLAGFTHSVGVLEQSLGALYQNKQYISPFILHSKCSVQDDRQGRYQKLFMSFYKTPNDLINKLSHILPGCLILLKIV